METRLGRLSSSLSIDDLVFRVAVEYKNLYRRSFSELDIDKMSSTQREAITTKTGISYAERDNNRLILYIRLAPYIIKVDEEHYLFNEVPIGGMFNIKENLIAFTGSPKILAKEDYHHPRVYAGNIIDFGSENRWNRLDILWGHWYDTTRDGAVYRIAKWLDEGRIALQEGCFGGINQVHLLNIDNFKSEYRTPKEAVRSNAEIIANRGEVCHQIN